MNFPFLKKKEKIVIVRITLANAVSSRVLNAVTDGKKVNIFRGERKRPVHCKQMLQFQTFLCAAIFFSFDKPNGATYTVLT